MLFCIVSDSQGTLHDLLNKISTGRLLCQGFHFTASSQSSLSWIKSWILELPGVLVSCDLERCTKEVHLQNPASGITVTKGELHPYSIPIGSAESLLVIISGNREHLIFPVHKSLSVVISFWITIHQVRSSNQGLLCILQLRNHDSHVTYLRPQASGGRGQVISARLGLFSLLFCFAAGCPHPSTHTIPLLNIVVSMWDI